MAKHFKAKKKFSNKKMKRIIYGSLILLIAFFTFNYVGHLKFATNNEEFVKYLLEDSNHFKEYNSYLKRGIYKVSKMLTGIDTSKPVSLLENEFLYKNKKDTSTTQITYDQNKDKTENKVETQNPQPTPEANVKKPFIYIYSTHQTEGYNAENLKDFNISPDVMMASYLLKDRLEKLGATVLIEERRMSDYLKQHNLNYDHSYTASRYYLEDTLKNHQNIDLIIDLHRDALAKNLSTTTIENKNYAKILFVLGGKPHTYPSNLALVTQLNNSIKTKYPTLSRGLLIRDTSVYNQDVSGHSILLELGGNENTVEEVMNTVEAIAPFIYGIAGGQNGGQ